MDKIANHSLAQDNLETLVSSQGNNNSIDNFWSRFRIFPIRFDEWNFDHWWLFLIVFYIGWITLSLFWDFHSSMTYGGFVCQVLRDCNETYGRPPYNAIIKDFNYALTVQFLHNYPIHLFIVGQFFLIFLFNNWRKKIPPFFQELQKKKIKVSVEEANYSSPEYQKFLDEYQKALLSQKRYLVLGILLFCCLIFFFFEWSLFPFQNTITIYPYNDTYFHYSTSTQDSFLAAVGNILIIWEALSIILLCYFVAIGGWVMFVTGLYLEKLTARFKLYIQPSHPDKCGGLKSLGSFCLNMALIIILLAMFQSFYGLTYNPKSFWSLGTIDFMVPLILVVAYLAFLLPLFGIHRQMVHRREEDEDEYANRISKLEANLRSSWNWPRKKYSRKLEINSSLTCPSLQKQLDCYRARLNVSGLGYKSTLSTRRWLIGLLAWS
jgi:hypothetical protein